MRRNSVRILLVFMGLYVLSNTLLSQTTVESVDPTVAQFSIVHGTGDPSYNGALNVNIPLMTVPGRGGLNYDINLTYIHGNGVPASESATWVGLGWNLNMYQISCSPSIVECGASGVINQKNDTYFLSYPGGSTEIYNFNPTGDDWYPLNWSKIKIKAIRDLNSCGQKEYAKFIVTDVDGTQYIYSARLMQLSSGKLRNHCEESGHKYGYVFKLTEIRGTNFVDNGNDVAGPEDAGSWIKLNYYNPTDDIYGMQVSYLASVETPTHIATFTRSLTKHAYLPGGIYYQDKLEYLDNIQLQKKDGAVIKTVRFNISKSFTWAAYDGNGNVHYHINDMDSRLRLNSIEIAGQSDEKLPSYQFEYNTGPAVPFAQECFLDPWGYFSLTVVNDGHYEPGTPYWMLKKITYPTGDSISFEYEPNQYEGSDPAYFYGGGVRLKKQIMRDAHTGIGSVYQYDYAVTSEGRGFISCEPPVNSWAMRNNISGNKSYDVHYPNVKLTRPDGSSVIKYYTYAVNGWDMDYTPYKKSYETITYETDADLSSYWISNPTNFYKTYFEALNAGQPLYTLLWTFPDRLSYASSYDAFIGQSKAFDDMNSYTYYAYAGFRLIVNLPIFYNTWKRGHITREEYFSSAGDTVQKKIYYYTMKPVKSFPFQYYAYNGAAYAGLFPGTITSGWARLDKIETKQYDQNGQNPVTSTVQNEYNANGMITKKTEDNVNNVKRITLITYANDKYVGMDTTNMLTQVAQQTINEGLGNSILGPRSSQVTTWKLWNTRWAPSKTYKWAEADGMYTLPIFDFENWSDASEPSSPSEWVRTSKLLSRDANGSELEVQNANGITSSAKWGYNGSLPIAQIANAKKSETAFADFEDGTAGDWNTETNGASSSIAHTGRRGWFLSRTSFGHITRTFQAVDLITSRKYTLSGWVKTSSTRPVLLWYVKYNGGSSETYPLSVYASGTGDWQYLECTLDFSAYPNITFINVYARNGNGTNNENCYWDDLRFIPADAQITTHTFDPGTFQVTSKSDENSSPVYFSYDGLGRLINVKDWQNNILKDYVYYYSRQGLGNNDHYNVNDPNYIQERTYRDVNDCTTSKTYGNGGGNVIQKQLFIGDDDIIAHTDYDNMARPQYAYKPYQVSLMGSKHTYDGVYSSHTVSYYQTHGISLGQFPYNETIYTNDPLDRVQKQAFPGDTYKNGSGHEVKLEYWTENGYIKNSKKDEDNRTVDSYLDLFGNVTKSVNNVVATVTDPTNQNLTTTFEYGILGELKKTKPPKGYTDGTEAYNTTYQYNTAQQLTQKTSPDAGTVKYKYDKNGNVRFMQDAKQTPNRFTYQKYDALNRLIEVGEYNGSSAYTQGNAELSDFPQDGDGAKNRTKKFYYNKLSTYAKAGGQRNIKGRLSYSESYRSGSLALATSYSYNEMGRVEWMVQYDSYWHAVRLTYTYDQQGNIIQKGYISL